MIEFITPILIILGSGIYICIALVALLESTPIIGTFTPGTFIILFCGFMVSEGYIDFIPTLTATVIGSVLGDMIGYYFGIYGRAYIHDHKGILRTSHIEMGRGFFTKHGGKSILIGRFAGPVRSIISVVAGTVNMSLRKFLTFNITGAVIWSFIYVYLGYAFGSQLKTIEHIISRTGIVVALVVIAIATLVFHIRKRDAVENNF
jgi:undecaprenyl-diphosphatase